MAGADIATVDYPLAANINPANPARMATNDQLQVWMELWTNHFIEHSDSVGNDEKAAIPVNGLLGGGFSHRPAPDSPWVFTFAATAAGGVGNSFEDLQTTAGNRDDLEALFGVFRILPSVAWAANEKLSLGASLNINYSEADQKVFPDTSIAASTGSPFYGIELEGLSGLSFSYSLGLNYRFSEALQLGLSYQSPTEIRLENGKASVNFSAEPGGSIVHYDDASIRGLKLAEEFGLGIAWQISPRWMIAADIVRQNWEDAFAESRLQLSQPYSSTAPAVIRQTAEIGYHNQTAYAIGTRYQYSDNLQLYAGFLYAKIAAPRHTETPTGALLFESHFAAGLTWQINDRWELGFAGMITKKEEREFSSNDLPIGDRAKQEAQVLLVDGSLIYRW